MLIVEVFKDLNALLNEKPAEYWAPLFVPFGIAFLASVLDFYAAKGLLSPMSLVSFAAAALLALSTHRLVILGPASLNRFGYAGLEARELSYFMYFLLIELGLPIVFMLPLLIAAVIADAGETVAMPWQYLLFMLLASAAIGSRLCLTLPASAVDRPISLGDSWTATGPFWFSMFTIFGLIPLMLTAPAFLIDETDSDSVHLTTKALLLAVLVFNVVLLSLTFVRVGKRLQHTYGDESE